MDSGCGRVVISSVKAARPGEQPTQLTEFILEVLQYVEDVGVEYLAARRQYLRLDNAALSNLLALARLEMGDVYWSLVIQLQRSACRDVVPSAAQAAAVWHGLLSIVSGFAPVAISTLAGGEQARKAVAVLDGALSAGINAVKTSVGGSGHEVDVLAAGPAAYELEGGGPQPAAGTSAAVQPTGGSSESVKLSPPRAHPPLPVATATDMPVLPESVGRLQAPVLSASSSTHSATGQPHAGQKRGRSSSPVADGAERPARPAGGAAAQPASASESGADRIERDLPKQPRMVSPAPPSDQDELNMSPRAMEARLRGILKDRFCSATHLAKRWIEPGANLAENDWNWWLSIYHNALYMLGPCSMQMIMAGASRHIGPAAVFYELLHRDASDNCRRMWDSVRRTAYQHGHEVCSYVDVGAQAILRDIEQEPVQFAAARFRALGLMPAEHAGGHQALNEAPLRILMNMASSSDSVVGQEAGYWAAMLSAEATYVQKAMGSLPWYTGPEPRSGFVRPARKLLLAIAEAGHPGARHMMSADAEKDLAHLNRDAVHWCTLAAEALSPEALNNAGVVAWRKGDIATAHKLFGKARRRGVSAAYYNLAVLFHIASKPYQSVERARKHYLEAAGAGLEWSHLRLAELCVAEVKPGMPRSESSALYRRALQRIRAYDVMADIARSSKAIGFELWRDIMTPIVDELWAVAKPDAPLPSLPKASMDPPAAALARVGVRPGEDESAVTQYKPPRDDETELANLCRPQNDRGAAAWDLACYYTTVQPGDRDTKMRALRIAASLKVVPAMYYLGLLISDSSPSDVSRGIDPILTQEAVEWITRAASEGHAVSAYLIAKECAGKGAMRKALDWYRVAALNGHDKSERLLAWEETMGIPDSEVQWWRNRRNSGVLGSDSPLTVTVLHGDSRKPDVQLITYKLFNAS